MTSASTIATTLLSNIFANCFKLGEVRPWAHPSINVKFSLRWKCHCLLCTIQLPPMVRLAHSPNPLIFPETNYAGVRDLTHKFRAAGGFSDFNHTSMLAPQSNLNCLSQAPNPLPAMHRLLPGFSPVLRSVVICAYICQPSLWHCLSSWQEKNSRRGLRRWRTESKSDDFLVKQALILTHADADFFLCQERVSKWSKLTRAVSWRKRVGWGTGGWFTARPVDYTYTHICILPGENCFSVKVQNDISQNKFKHLSWHSTRLRYIF